MTALNPLHTIGKQIGESLNPGNPQKSSKSTIIELLDKVGLSHFQNPTECLSSSALRRRAQRVMIAMAIARKPELLNCR